MMFNDILTIICPFEKNSFGPVTGIPWYTMVYHGIPWYTIYHPLPVVVTGSTAPSINQPTDGKGTSMKYLKRATSS